MLRAAPLLLLAFVVVGLWTYCSTHQGPSD